jgi:hypothetical protein
MNRENVKQILINQRVKRIKWGVDRKLFRADSVNTRWHSVKELGDTSLKKVASVKIQR